MSYVDAGYAVGLSVLFAYGLGLVLRRRALERRAEISRNSEPDQSTAGPERAEP